MLSYLIILGKGLFVKVSLKPRPICMTPEPHMEGQTPTAWQEKDQSQTTNVCRQVELSSGLVCSRLQGGAAQDWWGSG